MSETVITVQGTASAKRPPERATVTVTVAHDGPDRDTVFADTTRVADGVTSGLTELHDAARGPVVSWSSDRLGVWSERPWNNDGKQLPLVHHAALGVRATFSDFDALSRWVASLATTTGVAVGSIEWELLDTTRDALLEQVRTRAVQDAAAKALVYAKAAGLDSVTAIAIADPGLLGGPGDPGFVPAPAAPRMFAAKAMSDGPALSFTPQELELTAQVDARFRAS